MRRPPPTRAQKFDEFARSIVTFAVVGVPAALVNSGLKYMQKQIELAFQVRGVRARATGRLAAKPWKQQGGLAGPGCGMRGVAACRAAR